MYLFDRTSTKNLVIPLLGNRPMLDADLQLEPNRLIFKRSSIDARLPDGGRSTIAMPIFAEAAAQAVRLLDAPIAILTTGSGSEYLISAIVGLERLKQIGSDADLHLALAGLEYCHAQTIGSNDRFALANLCDDLLLAQSALHRRHGIQAYLGSPIRTAAGDLLGAISILDFSPRQFSDRESEILQSIGRWNASEFERKLLSQAQLDRWVSTVQKPNPAMRGFDDRCAALEHERSVAARQPLKIATRRAHSDEQAVLSILQGEDSPTQPQIQTELQFKLLTHLAQELRTPLTSVVGMTSVLQQEIYGTLNDKQKDYLEIVHHSGERLVALVNEISELGGFVGIAAAAERQQSPQLTLQAVDVELLCRLALQSLEPLIQDKHLHIEIELDIKQSTDGTNARMWVLDRDKVRQIIYYLCLSSIEVTAPHERISLHVANFTDRLQIQIYTHDRRVILHDLQPIERTIADRDGDLLATSATNIGRDLRIRLGLSLCQTLAHTHDGKIAVLANHRGYQLDLPLIVGDTCDDNSKR
jgi:signal transduction histidine kinase